MHINTLKHGFCVGMHFEEGGVACSSREDKGKVDVDSDVPIKASEFSDIGAGNVVGKGGRGVQVEGKDVGGLR